MQTQIDTSIITSTITPTVATATVKTMLFGKTSTWTIPEKSMGLNEVLARLHHGILPKCGRVIVKCPNLNCFPKDTVDGIRKAKELGKKWSDAFYNRRWNNDFKLAGLWTRFFFDTKNRVIKVTIEPKRDTSLTFNSSTTETISVDDTFVESEEPVEKPEELVEDSVEELVEESVEDPIYTDIAHVPNHFPVIHGWTMTPYGWMMAQQPWNPHGWGFTHPQMMGYPQMSSQL